MTTNPFRKYRFPMLLSLVAISLNQLANAAEPLKIWYDQPAGRWEEAVPVGNGRLGAMVFGGINEELIQLNEESIWAGPPFPQAPPGAYQALQEARRLTFAGEYAKAEAVLGDRVLAPRISPRSYQPLGDLRLHFFHEGEPVGYRRELDLRAAVATTSYEVDGAKYRREVFVSEPHQVIVLRLSVVGQGRINCDIALSRPEASVSANGERGLLLAGQARHGDAHHGVRYHAELFVDCVEGSCVAADDRLRVKGARSATVYIAAATDYNRSAPESPLSSDLSATCRETLAAVASREVDEIAELSIASHRKLFDRVSIDLGPGNNLPTDIRLQEVKSGVKDPGLAALYFQYGRYLLICCSRPGDLPANLQGLWNPHLEAPWNSDYHININLQMNYWPAEVANLSECHLPLFDYVERLVPAGRALASSFGCRGFCGTHTSDVWHYLTPFGEPRYGMWVLGPAWCSQHFMEHYRYTGDREFLRQRAYPILKEASLFFCDWLVKDPKTGRLVSGPSTSPENRFFADDGTQSSVSMGCGMDQQVIWETFTNTLEAAEILKIEDDFVREVRAKREELAPTRIGSDGRLMEWHEEFREVQPGHRHVSHLFGLHPGRQFTKETTPELLAAARKSLDYRLAHGGGHTGWSRAWMISFWARLQDASKAHENVHLLLANSTLPNLFDTHPPFQIDGNFGGAAGIAEMLLQSHQTSQGIHVVELLPSLPDDWHTGHVSGLRARGGLEIDIAWTNGQLKTGTVVSAKGGRFILAYNDQRYTLEAEGMQKYRLDELGLLARR